MTENFCLSSQLKDKVPKTLIVDCLDAEEIL